MIAQENLRCFAAWAIASETADDAGMKDLMLSGTKFSIIKTIAAIDDFDISTGLFGCSGAFQ